MMPGRPAASVLCALLLAGLLGLASSCAISVPPSGGAPDVTAPRLLGATPDSGATGLPVAREITLHFSEKMKPQPAERFLFTYPPQEVEATHWKGRIEVRVVFREPFPPDTVVVVELAPRLDDNHGVAFEESRRWPFATADSLPVGQIEGRLLAAGEALTRGLLELYDLPPDSVDFFTQDVLRRTVTDSLGRYCFDWLPAPGGPWLIRAANDFNGNLRIDEKEGRRLLPGDYSLTVDTAAISIDTVSVYSPGRPGMLVGIQDSLVFSHEVWAWPLTIAETDTGWTAEPQTRAPVGMTRLVPGVETVIMGAGPGLVRLIFFVDADGDSLAGLLPRAPNDTTETRMMERMALLDSLVVEAGLPTPFTVPAFPDTCPLWQPPAGYQAALDSIAAAESLVDSLGGVVGEEGGSR